MPTSLKAVVMAGGRGERFWPASTPDRPKQFIDLTGEGTLIQQTVLRLAQIVPFRDIYVVTSEVHLAMARTQLPQVPDRNFIVEPVGRDTAACIGLAAVWLEKIDPDAIMLVVPSDHFIPDTDRFCDLATVAVNYARQSEGLVTLGIHPDRPEVGYGYIQIGEVCPDAPGKLVYRAERFVEKPDRDRAEEYLADGRYLWNAGMFTWSVRAIREEIARHLPELHVELEVLATVQTLEEFKTQLPIVFNRIPKISIDYGVMERSDRVFVVPSDFRWDDLGNWAAMARLRPADEHGNVLRGLVLTEDCHNVLVESKGRLVATLGVSDLIVVETDDAVLVCAQDRAQDIRRLAAKAQEAVNAHRQGDVSAD